MITLISKLRREELHEGLSIILDAAREIDYHLNGDYISEDEDIAIYVKLKRISSEIDGAIGRIEDELALDSGYSPQVAYKGVKCEEE